MERLNKPRAASIAFSAVLASVASGSPVPQNAAAALAHAQEAAGANQRRFDACRDALLG